jgi:hypothetical protein
MMTNQKNFKTDLKSADFATVRHRQEEGEKDIKTEEKKRASLKRKRYY